MKPLLPFPATGTAPPSAQDELRWSSRMALDTLYQFAARLKANARWMKQFLHGSN